MTKTQKLEMNFILDMIIDTVRKMEYIRDCEICGEKAPWELINLIISFCGISVCEKCTLLYFQCYNQDIDFYIEYFKDFYKILSGKDLE